MEYPDSFKKKVYELYPDWPELHKLLKDGAYFVGRYLDDASEPDDEEFGVNAILESDSLESLKNKARILKKKIELCNEWRELAYRNTP